MNHFHFTGDPQSPRRSLPSRAPEPHFIGLQSHTVVRAVPPDPKESAVGERDRTPPIRRLDRVPADRWLGNGARPTGEEGALLEVLEGRYRVVATVIFSRWPRAGTAQLRGPATGT